MSVAEVRGEPVVLDVRLAQAFGIMTGHLNEIVKRNPRKFNETHCFRLTAEEYQALISQFAITKQGRGGSQFLPQVFTARGVVRVATVLNTDEAIELADHIVDTYLTVQRQVIAGQQRIQIEEPSRFRPEGDFAEIRELRKKLFGALSSLVDAMLEPDQRAGVGNALTQTATNLFQHVQDRLREKGLNNEKLVADTVLVLEQAEKVAEERRNLAEDREGKRLRNIREKIAIVRDMLDLQKQIEGPEVIELLASLNSPSPLALPAPSKDDEDNA